MLRLYTVMTVLTVIWFAGSASAEPSEDWRKAGFASLVRAGDLEVQMLNEGFEQEAIDDIRRLSPTIVALDVCGKDYFKPESIYQLAAMFAKKHKIPTKIVIEKVTSFAMILEAEAKESTKFALDFCRRFGRSSDRAP